MISLQNLRELWSGNNTNTFQNVVIPCFSWHSQAEFTNGIHTESEIVMITIRSAKREDAETIEKLYAELEKDAVYYQPEHFVISAEGKRTLQFYELLEDKCQAVIVAEDAGVIIGFAHVRLMSVKNISCLKRQSNVYIQDMIVNEKYRNLGIGSRLMSAVKEYGRQNNADFVRTQVFPLNKDGLRFYQRNGFSITMLTIEAPMI